MPNFTKRMIKFSFINENYRFRNRDSRNEMIKFTGNTKNHCFKNSRSTKQTSNFSVKADMYRRYDPSEKKKKQNKKKQNKKSVLGDRAILF